MIGTEEFLVYGNFEYADILEGAKWLFDHVPESSRRDEFRKRAFGCVRRMVEVAESYGLEGNIWHTYLTMLLVKNENAFTMACEITGSVDGTIMELARQDIAGFRELFALDWEPVWERAGCTGMELLGTYKNAKATGSVYNARIRSRICELAGKLGKAADLETFLKELLSFYKDYGVGKLGLHKAFRIEHRKNGAKIIPITNIAHVNLDDLVGYDIPKQKLIENTEAFVEGRKANNCLLFGDAGTGKSSSIKGILNKYYDQGLRIIEVYKHQFQDLNDVIAQIKNRNYKFIIYMDDLSFEEFEIEYKYLKAVIEGGLEKKPDNILIYATSNRRHLIKENFSDKEGRRDHLHASDTVQEKLSLVARFGVTIFFISPDKQEFQNIVRVLADRNGITMGDEELMLEANRWEMNHGGKSGRTAQQFIDYLLGKKEEG